MEIGIFWGNIKDAYPGITDEMELSEKAKHLGFSYVETDYEELAEKSPAFFEKAEALSLGFAVYAFADENCVLGNGTKAEDCLPFLQEHHIKNLMMVCKPADKTDRSERINQAIFASLNRLTYCAEKYGITVSAENFDSHTIPCGNCEDMLRFGSEVPKLRYTLDTGNFAFFGEDVLACFEKIKGRISHVHLKDRVSMQDLKVTVTGQGGLPLKEILQRLVAMNYNGKLSVEMFGASDSPEALQKSLAFVKSCIGE